MLHISLTKVVGEKEARISAPRKQPACGEQLISPDNIYTFGIPPTFIWLAFGEYIEKRMLSITVFIFGFGLQQ